MSRGQAKASPREIAAPRTVVEAIRTDSGERRSPMEKRRASEEEARLAREAKLELERQLEKEKNKPPEVIFVDGGGCAPLSPSSGSSGGRRRGPVMDWVRNKDGSRNMKYKTKRMVSPITGKPDRRCRGNK